MKTFDGMNPNEWRGGEGEKECGDGDEKEFGGGRTYGGFAVAGKLLLPMSLALLLLLQLIVFVMIDFAATVFRFV